MKISKNKNYIDVAVAVSARSHDAETKVGALLVENESGAILSTGYNGFVRGADDEGLPNTRPDKYEYMLHAEVNLITNAARHGISTNNTTLVCTMSPCKHCMRMLVNCGITKVITKELYKDFNDILSMKDISVQYELDSENLYHITYSVNKKDQAD